MKKVIDYSITQIYFYRFVCNDPNISNMYVGSSIDLTQRKSQHKSACNNANGKHHHLLVYKTIRDNGGWDNWRMLEIEHKIVKDKTEATQREQYWIEFYNAQMNTFKLNFNKQEHQREYREQNREQINAKHREYNEQNREQIDAKLREYYEQNKEQINAKHREYREQNKEQINAKHREYYEQNKEQIDAQKREYREQHREKINAQKREYRKRKKEEKQNVIEV